MSPETWLNTIETISKVLSIAAIPVVLAVGGWLIQRQLQDQTIRRDYVQLAVSILQNPDPSKVPRAIREWAVDLLNENSPTKLNARAIQDLKSGAITLSGFSFVPSDALTPSLQRTLESSFGNFRTYMVKLGFVVPSEAISVKISPGTMVNGQGVAIWDANTHTISVASAFASDDASVLRQFAHSLLPRSEKPSLEYSAIESGLATYFPCSFTDNPVLGGKAAAEGKAILPPQDLQKHHTLAEIHLSDWASVQNDGSKVWGGVLWEIRQLLGREAADRMIADTWQAFSPSKGEHTYLSFANKLLANSRTIESGEYTGQIRSVFKALGLRV
jgi:hypothetical protein